MIELNGVKLEMPTTKKEFIIKNMHVLQSEIIRLQCNVQGEELSLKTIYAILEFFNLLYGNGTDKKITGGKANLISCMGLLNSFLQQVVEEFKISEIEQKKLSKYNKKRLVRV